MASTQQAPKNQVSIETTELGYSPATLVQEVIPVKTIQAKDILLKTPIVVSEEVIEEEECITTTDTISLLMSFIPALRRASSNNSVTRR